MKSVSKSFSAESKEMMAVAKEIAIELGYDRISTLHFFLADCRQNKESSLRRFAFDTEEEYQQFYDDCRKEKPTSFTNSPVPLTSEAEKALRVAVQVWFRRYLDEEINSYHILIAAGRNSGSAFASRMQLPRKLARHLEQYYIQKGILQENNIRRNFWEKLLWR